MNEFDAYRAIQHIAKTVLSELASSIGSVTQRYWVIRGSLPSSRMSVPLALHGEFKHEDIYFFDSDGRCKML